MGADTCRRVATRATTRVMSCDATVIVTAAEPSGMGFDSQATAKLARQAIGRLGELEQRWSRFRPASEISELNNAEGAPRTVSHDTMRLIEALVQAWHVTDGAFDPTLLGTLVELGYAASRDDATLRTSLAPEIMPRGRPADILVEPSTGWVQMPRGTTLDPGGLGKGLAADIVVEELIAAGALGALVEIGGDIRVAGAPPSGSSWTIAVAPVAPAGPPRIVQLADGGIATSTSRLRTWNHDGRHQHHLVDPRTLRSADTGAVSCTVIAGSAAWAEAFTKIAFADDTANAMQRYDSRQLAASISTADEAQHESVSWREFCR